MSGGSFDYLYLKENKDLLDRIEDVSRMRDYLKANGCKESSEATNKLIKKLKKIVELDTKELRQVWHAAEWLSSGDWGREDLIKANKKFGKEMSK